MKFVALAVALLLVVGSQAASLQADAPSQLAHIRSALDLAVNQFKDYVNNALKHLDDTEYKNVKDRVSQRMDEMQAQLKHFQSQVSPVTDNIVSTIADATAEFRASVLSDIEALKTELEPKRAKLREVVHKHIEEYRAHLQPILSEYYAQHTAEMDALKAKLDPVLEELRAKVSTNVEETKSALVPILESIRAKVNTRLENLKELVTPYVEEYKDQLKTAYDQAQTINADEINALREKITPILENIKTNFHSLFETVAGTITKS